MSELKPQGIVDNLNQITISTLTKKQELVNKKLELEKTTIYNEIQDLEYELKELATQDKELREQGKQILIDSWIKKFEALDWTTIQLNKKPWVLVIENENNIELDDYWKEKVTRTMDKKQLKEDIKQWVVINGVYIKEDFSLVIKNK